MRIVRSRMPGKRAHGPVGVGAVRETVVDLVAVDEQVVADRDGRQLVLDLGRQHGPGRVARVAQEQRLGPRRDGRLDRRRVDREVVLEARRDVPDRPTGEHDRRDIGDVRRLVQDDLVARVAGGPEGEIHRLRGADGDQQSRSPGRSGRRSGGPGDRRGRAGARRSRSSRCSASALRGAISTPASTIARGVSKSGSPTPRLMTSSIVAAMSKKRRIPTAGRPAPAARGHVPRSAGGSRAPSRHLGPGERRQSLRRCGRRGIVEGGEVGGLEEAPVGRRCDRLVAARQAEQRGLGPWRADQLQPDGQAVRETGTGC